MSCLILRTASRQPVVLNHNEFSANTQRLSLPVERPASLRPGVWYRMHMGRDHFATKNLDNLRRIAALLDALPITPPVKPSRPILRTAVRRPQRPALDLRSIVLCPARCGYLLVTLRLPLR